MTECIPEQMSFGSIGRREMVAKFDGGMITSNGGVLLLGAVEKRIKLLERFAECFIDSRDARFVELPVQHLAGQRVLGLALGYEDLNDHDALRRDPVLAAVVGAVDVAGTGRRRSVDRGCALAGKSTLNRLELSTASEDRYKKIQALRRLAFQGTVFAKAQCHTLRKKLLKIGARIRITARKLWVSLPTAYPYRDVFIAAVRRLHDLPLRI